MISFSYMICVLVPVFLSLCVHVKCVQVTTEVRRESDPENSWRVILEVVSHVAWVQGPYIGSSGRVARGLHH